MTETIKPIWTSTAIREVAVGEVTRFHTCKITDNLELFDITLIGPNKEGLEEIRDKVINSLLNK